MDNKDSNMKPQQTGGLKLMTVFIAVLALHVVVIGGFTVYHLMSGGSADTDLSVLDKTHKGSALADGTMPDLNQGDKNTPASAPTPPAEVASIPASSITPPAMPAPSLRSESAPAPTPASPPTQVPIASTETTAPPTTPVPAVTPTPAPIAVAPKPAAPTPPAEVADQGAETSSGPISPELAPPAEPTLVAPSPTLEPLAPIATGPVHMPPSSAVASTPVHERQHEHEQIYVVKITDSYKKIAHAHHVTVAQLKEANHIRGDVLHTGQKLFIPSSHTLVASTASVINTSLDATPTEPVFANAVSSTVTTTAMPHHHLYTVVKGDTLIKIAHRFKTTSSAIMAANGISNPAKLTIGKKLKIPSSESRSARNNGPSLNPAQPSQVQAQPDDASSGELANFVP